MKFTAIIVASLAAIAHAAKIEQVEGGELGVGYDQVRDESWADKYDHADLDGANQAIADWYNTAVLPVLNDHRDFVSRYYYGLAESERDQLLATCEKGTECREENVERVRIDIATEWERVMTNFKTDVQTTLIKTENLVNDGWTAAVQCEIDHPCCSYDETSWDNINTQIKNHVNTIIEKRKQVQEIQRRVTDMKLECESYNIPWEEYDRKADQMDEEAAANDIDYNDVTALDEKLFGADEPEVVVAEPEVVVAEPEPEVVVAEPEPEVVEEPVEISIVSEDPPSVEVEEPVQFFWTEEFTPEYPANYEFHVDDASYDNPMVGLIDSGSQYRWDYKFADGSNTEEIVWLKQNDIEEWEDNLGDGAVRRVRMQICDTELREMNVRGLEFYDANSALLLSTGHLKEESDECVSSYIDLDEGQRIVGLRADTSYDWTDDSGNFRDGYWRNLQFLVANF